MVSTAIQLFTLRDHPDTLDELLDSVAAAGYDGVEFNETFYPLADGGIERVRAALDRTGLDVAGVQVSADALDDPRTLAETYSSLNCTDVILSYLDESHFETRESVLRTARRLSEWATQLEEFGCTLHYHNHDHEFRGPDGETAETPFDLLVAEADKVDFEVDVGWVAAAGYDPAELLGTFGERVRLVHAKDMEVTSATPVEIGTGDVDMEACIRAAREIGAEWIIYEHDHPEDPAASLSHGASVLANH